MDGTYIFILLYIWQAYGYDSYFLGLSPYIAVIIYIEQEHVAVDIWVLLIFTLLYTWQADEYDGCFLGLSPSIAVITNVEWEHVDIFQDEVWLRITSSYRILMMQKFVTKSLCVLGLDWCNILFCAIFYFFH